jgi:hypothetical protein
VLWIPSRSDGSIINWPSGSGSVIQKYGSRYLQVLLFIKDSRKFQKKVQYLSYLIIYYRTVPRTNIFVFQWPKIFSRPPKSESVIQVYGSEDPESERNIYVTPHHRSVLKNRLPKSGSLIQDYESADPESERNIYVSTATQIRLIK